MNRRGLISGVIALLNAVVALPADDGDSRFFAGAASGAWQVEGIRSIALPSAPITGVSWTPSEVVSIDDCSVFLAYGDREDYVILDCVGVEIRAADFEMPPWPYFLVNAEGDPVDIADLPVVVTLAEFRTLPIQGGELMMQPPSSQVLINIDTIAYSTARTHILPTRILGTPVSVRATPVAWTWDFGGGTEPFVTEGPGGPYPNREVSRVYRLPSPEVAIRLTVTWAGEYRVNDAGPWLPVAGTTTTTATSPTFAVVEAPARLVAGEIEG